MTNSSLWARALRWFYGIEDIDEYREAEVNRIGNRLYMGYFSVAILSFPIALSLSKWPEKAFWFLFMTHFLYLFASTGYMLYQIRKLELTRIDVEETDFEQVRRQKLRRLRRHTWFAAIIYHLFTSMSHVDFVLSKVMAELVSPARLIATLIYWLGFYYTMKWFLLKDIHKDKTSS